MEDRTAPGKADFVYRPAVQIKGHVPRMARTTVESIRSAARRAGNTALALALLLLFAACSEAEGNDPPEILPSATSGAYSSTISPDRENEVPFSEVVYVNARFEDEIYGLAGQTAVKVTTDPSSYRVEPQRPPDLRTYRVALLRRVPGTVTVSVYENSQAEPVEFTLVIGGVESED